MIRRLHRLLGDNAGSTLVEFAILAPAILTMLFGVLQVGMWMQSYNALRMIAADAGRYTAVQYQKGFKPTNSEISTWVRDNAIKNNKLDGVDIVPDVIDRATAEQAIPGVTEKTLTLTATLPSTLSFIGIGDQEVVFTRPIFVKAS